MSSSAAAEAVKIRQVKAEPTTAARAAARIKLTIQQLFKVAPDRLQFENCVSSDWCSSVPLETHLLELPHPSFSSLKRGSVPRPRAQEEKKLSLPLVMYVASASS